MASHAKQPRWLTWLRRKPLVDPALMARFLNDDAELRTRRPIPAPVVDAPADRDLHGPFLKASVVVPPPPAPGGAA